MILVIILSKWENSKIREAANTFWKFSLLLGIKLGKLCPKRLKRSTRSALDKKRRQQEHLKHLNFLLLLLQLNTKILLAKEMPLGTVLHGSKSSHGKKLWIDWHSFCKSFAVVDPQSFASSESWTGSKTWGNEEKWRTGFDWGIFVVTWHRMSGWENTSIAKRWNSETSLINTVVWKKTLSSLISRGIQREKTMRQNLFISYASVFGPGFRSFGRLIWMCLFFGFHLTTECSRDLLRTFSTALCNEEKPISCASMMSVVTWTAISSEKWNK